MTGINRAIILGNVGSDPEIKSFGDATTIAKFSIATNEKWTDKKTGELKEETTWHRITCFGKLAGIAEQYVRKGKQLYVEGKIKNSKYTDKDGIEKYSTDIICDNFQLLGGRDTTAETAAPRAAPKPPTKEGSGVTPRPMVKNFAPNADNSHLEKDPLDKALSENGGF